MMVSPETYYEAIKDKSAKELQIEIRSLKREITKLKDEIEDPNGKPDFICPSRDVRIFCSREYLEIAKKALAEAGGEYRETEAERRAAAFLAKLPCLKRIVFKIGGIFKAWEQYTVEITDDTIHASGTIAEYQDYLPLNGPISINVWGQDQRISTKEQLLEYLSELHLEEWRHNYDPERFGVIVLDGIEWDLKLEFSSGHRSWKTGGSNDYPYNFQDFLWLFSLEHPNNIEDEREKHSEIDTSNLSESHSFKR